MSQLKRCQSAYSSFEEISAVINYTTQYYLLKEESDCENYDDLKIKVLKMAIQKHESKSAISISTVQRNFSVGFNKATRILEELATEGYLKKGVKYGYIPTITMQEFIEKFES